MKKYKPTTPSRRHMTVVTYRGKLTTSKPFKALTTGSKKTGGRNSQGRITTRHKGGGHKRKYREIDFMYNKYDIPARVETIEYDPNRSAFIGLVVYADGERRYVVLPQKMEVGSSFVVSPDAPIVRGNRLHLKNIPVGTFVYNVELQPGGGAKLARSAGAYIQVTAHDGGKTTLKMPSSEVRKVVSTCWASIGEVSNDEYKLMNKGKAGRSRWLGIRPTVRGSAMNPVDHPHGGGEGRQGIGLRRGPKTGQGKLAYGVKTRTPKKYSNKNIVTRRKTKRNQ
ncbi:MAG: 50S ribosomal protein L2 [Candidatus Pacebacteria bacterium]|nr:50S ribosomal protein L2 [Candidatus Paceibacterota bacterium]MCD8508122.1 50S ribosomal protein L2 [Candidatus Paceibacterota bacterium]MCD8527913.1 50S ribosomal protein L2 [Candidatus Paceibacterota bacterium]MCD8563758.1 50S ribosomal protein L2 [Candidatus Paceibacterota bacterium]